MTRTTMKATFAAALAGIFLTAGMAMAEGPAPVTAEQVASAARAYADTLADTVPSLDEKSCGTTYVPICVPSFCSIFASQPDMESLCVRTAMEHATEDIAARIVHEPSKARMAER